MLYSTKNSITIIPMNLFIKNIKMKSMDKKTREFYFVALLFFVLFFIYSPSINAPFIFDDKNNIENNKLILIKDLSWNSIENLLTSSRPLSMISFAFNYYIHGLDPSLFRITNILIHIFSSFILYSVLDATVSISREDYKDTIISKWFPMISAFLWSVHPLQIQSVTYVVQRMNILAGMFMLFSILIYIKARVSSSNHSKIILFSVSFFSALAAIGSKPNAAMIPFLVVMYEYFFFERSKNIFFDKKIIVLIAEILIILLISVNIVPEIKLIKLYKDESFYRIITEARVVIFYISLILFPHPSRLNIDHDIDVSSSIFSPLDTSYSISSIMLIILSAFLYRKKFNILSFGIFWFFLNLVIESTVIPLDLIFEHRNYIPSMMLISGMVFFEMRILKKNHLKFALLGSVAILWSFWTHQRNEVWKSGLSIWQDSMTKSQNKSRPHESLAYYLEKEGRTDDAIKHYEWSIKIDASNADAHNNLGTIYAKLGNMKLALMHYEHAININPKYKEAYNNIGNIIYKYGNFDISAVYYKKALEIDSGYHEAHGNLANSLAALDKNDLAIMHYNESISIAPENVNHRYNKSILLMRTGRIKEAEDEIKKIISLKSDFKEAFNNLGVIYERTGRLDAAEKSYKNALKIDPNFKDAKQNIDRLIR